jgi:hypothetical protein
VTIALAVCVVAVAVLSIAVHAWGGSGVTSPGGVTGVAGELLVLRSDGAVELLSADTGAVMQTLVGPAPVDSAGRHLQRPFGITAADGIAYVGYLEPSPVIESVPFGGGTPHFVTDGLYPSASHDGTELAFDLVTAGASSAAVAILDLATGVQHTLYSTPDGPLVAEGLSWSTDDTQLAVSGLFLPRTPLSPNVGVQPLSFEEGVQLFDLDQPVSATNPRFVGTPTALTAGTATWTDAQFLDSGSDVVVLSSRPVVNPCQIVPTQVLSVDPTTGQTTALTSLSFEVSDAVFDQTGTLVAFQRTLPPQSCRAAPTTTTTTTTTTPANGFAGVGVTGGGSFSGTASQDVLDGWSDGTTRTLATGVAAVAFVG